MTAQSELLVYMQARRQKLMAELKYLNMGIELLKHAAEPVPVVSADPKDHYPDYRRPPGPIIDYESTEAVTGPKPRKSKPRGDAQRSWSDVAGEDKLNPKYDATGVVPTGYTRAEHQRTKIEQFIQDTGPSWQVDIVDATGIPKGSIAALLNHSMFVSTAIGWGLSRNHK